MPRLVIAAPASGHGKTTVASGLMAALRTRGLVTSGHKVGPDYIDPGYHALATGRPARNLDPVLCGPDRIGPLFLHGAAGAGIAIVEGVMGLYDGRGLGSDGSTAQVARLLDAPVVLVVDATAQGRSVAALVAGFTGYDPRLRIGGVILNRVGSARHEEILRAALSELGMPVLGVLRRDDAISAPSRHLGLVPAAERDGAARRALRRLAGLIGKAVDLDAVIRLAATAGPLDAAPWSPDREIAGAAAAGAVIAVAGGAAFSFCYTETVELLAAAGAEVAVVDPLRDERLPARTAALVLGGGFPEVHAAELSANEPLRRDVAQLAAAGAPVVAECAGLLYLARSLDGKPMCGVLDATARMTGQLTMGYRDAVAAGDSVLATAGTAVCGHEFHRTVTDPPHPAVTDPPHPAVTHPPHPAVAGPPHPAVAGPPHAAEAAWRIGERSVGFAQQGVHASYLHLHWAGYPQLARRLAAAAGRAAGVAA